MKKISLALLLFAVVFAVAFAAASNISFVEICKKKAKPAMAFSKSATDVRMAIREVPEGSNYIISAVADPEDAGKVAEGF